MKEKNYVASSIKQKTFDNGGSVLNAAFKVDDLKKNSKKGWVNITIAERREPSEKGATHYAYVNEFEPKKKEQFNSHAGDEDLPF